jgi:rod shape-determining protein MreD
VKPALALVAMGILAIVLQSVVTDLFPGRVGPDLGFLIVVALGSRLRSTSGGLLLAALLGYLADLFSGSLLGLHALLRVLAFGAARLAMGHLNLRGVLPQAVFIGFLSVANALGVAILTAFFSPDAGFGLAPVGLLLGHATVNAFFGPIVARGCEWVLAVAGDADRGRHLLRLDRSWGA